MKTDDPDRAFQAEWVNSLAQEIHQTAVDKGFWDDKPCDNEDCLVTHGRNLGEMLMMVTCELAECLEEDREGHDLVWLRHDSGCNVIARANGTLYTAPPLCICTPKPEGALVEVADAIIRLFDIGHDMALRADHSLYDVIRMKMDYNNTRPHMHGKAY